MKRYTPVIIVLLVIIFGGAGFYWQYSRFRSQESEVKGTSTKLTPMGKLIDIGTIISPTPVTQAAKASDPLPTAAEILLKISQPASTSNLTVTSPTLVVKGQTVPRADVYVNDVETKADAKGNFSATLKLEDGDNFILVFANDDNGNYAQQEFDVNYEGK